MANKLRLFNFLRGINVHKYDYNITCITVNHHYSSDASSLQKTCLYDYHVKNRGKMVNFAGFSMPVQYEDQSISDSHLHTRQSSSIFDVSHMLQMIVKGKNRIDFMESITVADIANLKENSGTLTLYTNDNGGIIDDLIVTQTSNDYLYVVSNAGRIKEDLAHVRKKLELYTSQGKDVSIEVIKDKALLALQGPASSQCLQSLIKGDLSKLYFMMSVVTNVCGIDDCRVTRCGYTGEDGFEISIPADKAEFVSQTIIEKSNSKVKLAGLGPRDTLRLEAGLCLYGNDIDEDTTPIEAGLAWTIGKRRKELSNFPGASVITKQLKDKPIKRRVGIAALSGGPPVRSHSTVLDNKTKEKIGMITSGCPSPSLKRNIAMCYVPLSHSKIGTKVICDVRGKHFEYEIVKMPFIATNYYIQKK